MATLFYMLPAPQPPAGLHAQFPVRVAVAAGAANSPRAALIRDDGMAVVFSLGGGGCAFDVPLLPPRTHYVCAALGESHAVLVRDDGAAVSMGKGTFGECDVPELTNGKRFVATAVGSGFSVLLQDDGAAVGFGLNDEAGTRYITAAAGAKHSVLVRDDGAAVLACSALSSDTVEVPPPPVGGHYLAAAACDVYSVLVRNDGAAVVIGEQGCSHTRAPPLPAGTSYAGLKMRSWSPELNPLFPHSSRALVHSVLCTEKRRRQEGVSFVLPELLCTLVLPFVVPAAAVPAQATCSGAGLGSEGAKAEVERNSSWGLAAKCALGHELEPYVPGTMLPFDVHCCDACEAWISAPDKAHRCHLCNYDLCEACQRLGINNGIRMPG